MTNTYNLTMSNKFLSGGGDSGTDLSSGTGNINVDLVIAKTVTTSNLNVNGPSVMIGDLDVTGTLTTQTLVVVNEIQVEDTIINLGLNNPADALNTGFLEEFNDGAVKHSGLLRSAATKKQYLIEGATPIPTISTDLTVLPRGDLVLNQLNAAGVTVGAYSLPTDAGTSGEVLVSDGLGDSSWEANPTQSPITASTGVFTGGVITIGANTTLFDISAGTGQVANPNTGALTQVSWGALIGNNGVYSTLQTYILIDINGAVVKTATKPSNSDLRDNMLLGVLISTDTVNILAVASEQEFLGNTLNQISDLAAALGSINTSGNVMGPSVLLTVAKTTGTMYAFGSNAWNDKKNPSNITTGALDTNVSDVFQYFYQDGSFSGLITDVIPNEYDDGNGQATPGTVSNQNWQTQRVYLFPEGNIVILPGQFTYANLADAKAAINSEQFITLTNVSANGLLISYIFMRGGGSDLNTSPGDAEFLQASRISGASGATAGGDVNGPVSSTINGLCKFATTDGKTIKDNSGATLSDTGDLSLIGSLIFTDGPYAWDIYQEAISLVYKAQNGNTDFKFANNGFRTFTSAGNSPLTLSESNIKSRGTLAAPLPIQNGDAIFQQKNIGSNGVYGSTASQILTIATEDWAGFSSTGCSMTFSTSDNGPAQPTEKLRLDSLGVNILKKLRLSNSLIQTTASANTDLTSGNWTRTKSTGFSDRSAISNGTLEVPTAVINNQLLTESKVWAYNSAYSNPTTSVKIKTTEAHTPTASGVEMRFSTTDNGTNSISNKLLLDSTGVVAIDTLIPEVGIKLQSMANDPAQFTFADRSEYTNITVAANLVTFADSIGYRKVVGDQYIIPNDIAVGGHFTFIQTLGASLSGNDFSFGLTIVDEDTDYIGWHAGRAANDYYISVKTSDVNQFTVKGSTISTSTPNFDISAGVYNVILTRTSSSLWTISYVGLGNNINETSTFGPENAFSKFRCMIADMDYGNTSFFNATLTTSYSGWVPSNYNFHITETTDNDLSFANDTKTILNAQEAQVEIDSKLIVKDNILMCSNHWGYDVSPTFDFYTMVSGGVNLTNSIVETELQGGLVNFGNINVPSLRTGNVISLKLSGVMDAPSGSDCHIRVYLGGVFLAESTELRVIESTFVDRYWELNVQLVPYTEVLLTNTVFTQTNGLMVWNSEGAAGQKHSVDGEGIINNPGNAVPMNAPGNLTVTAQWDAASSSRRLEVVNCRYSFSGFNK